MGRLKTGTVPRLDRKTLHFRVGETVNAWLSGVNLPEQLVRVSLGEHPDMLPVAEPGRRTQSFFMILLSMAYKGCTRRELLKEII